MKTHHLCFIALLLLTIILAGCGTPPASPAPTETHVAATSTSPASETEPPAASDTPDPCVLPQLETEVQEVHKHMREFGDAAT